MGALAALLSAGAPAFLERRPLNRLETAVAEARAGRLSVADMLRALIAAELVVPSAAPVEPDGSGLRPLVLGARAVACFSAVERVRGTERAAPWLLRCPAATLLPAIARTHGLALNPGGAIGFGIDADGLRRALADLA